MQKDTSWQQVADWYERVPKEEQSNHQTIIIPNLIKQLETYLFPGAKVLDLASGEGTVTKALADAGYDMTGVDLANDLIETAKKQYPNIPFFVEDSQRISPEFIEANKASFDAIVCVLALQNMKSIKAAFKNAKELLKSKGHLFFIINHPSFRIPKATNWGFYKNVRQYRVVNRYMTADAIEIVAHPGRENSATTWTFHRPLQDYVKALKLNSMAVIDLEEWISKKVSEPGPRAKAENLARQEIPLFMSVIAQKIN